jgi:hypothetical protein
MMRVFFMSYHDERVTRTTFFSVISQGRELCNNTNIARSKELRYDKETQQSNFIAIDCKKATTMSISLCFIAREATIMIIFDVAKSGCIASLHATTISQPLHDARMPQSNNACAVGHKDDCNKQC